MSEHSFTPGPWDFDEGDLSIYAMGDGDDLTMLFQPHEMCDGDEMSWSQMVANTRLIAAAPELLETLTDILNRFEEVFPGTSDFLLFVKGRVVIAKATGAI